MNVKLGFDLNCFSNRYTEPEAWTDFVASCGVRVVQFNFDVIDFLLPAGVRDRLVARTNDCCARKNIRIKCAFGGHNHHQNYLGHPDDGAARAYEDFYRKMADVAAGLGAEGFGTCFAIMTCAVHGNPKRREVVFNRALDAYRRIAQYSKERGLRYLLYEMTSVSRETGATFEESDRILRELRDAAIPMKVCLDVGHRNRENDDAPEGDPYRWLERYGAVAPLVHIQQCDPRGSRHWPFVPRYNEMGDIDPGKVLDVLRAAKAKQEILLALEVRHAAYYPQEYELESDLRKSVAYWRKWIPAEEK